MTKDEVWERIKGDATTVYGVPMLEMFVKTTDALESRHYDELDRGMRSLVSPKVRLHATSDPKEARAAIKEAPDALSGWGFPTSSKKSFKKARRARSGACWS